MKWIDTTIFNGEPIIQLRLKYLSSAVDIFYICEQRYTFQGHRKDELFIEKYKEWFEPYKSKIRFTIDETNYEGTNAWVIENASRSYTLPYIMEENKNTEYIISVCDSDEIPDINVVKNKDNLYDQATNGAVVMQQPLYYYNLNWFVLTWRRAFFLNDKSVAQFKSFQLFRNEAGPIVEVFPCGWHMSYFMSCDDIRRKISSFAHTEVNLPEFKTYENIRESITIGRDVFKRYGVNLQRNTNFNFPPEVLEFHYKVLAMQGL